MYVELEGADFIPILRERLRFTDSILDVGCGIGAMWDYYDAPVIIGVDIHRPYLEHLVRTTRRAIPIHTDATRIGKLFMPNSFSAVTLIDSLEHFVKEDGLKVLAYAEQIAKDQVIVFTPRGFFPQIGVDNYNLNGEKYQTHYSGWEPEELLELGYHVYVIRCFHNRDNVSFVEAFGRDHPPVDAIFAWKEIG
ncbi:SAM-dependent methyltransferase [Paenibacillus shirakamiensis]|uniref:SAM-dependent methyltransferase n=1 Tax=Paenibacillus shirakamiensis TaxID=1265935 RepID=A0ABS4JKB5_9BACL|nr:class I SAM-dependent methyltransferase [Paenibacillus shirakamiensis]MBP2002142.1 SAM-dependent methyltransferase [Paenibacillus shirakamiensis]